MNHDPYNMEDINDIVLNRNNNDKSANIKKILTAVAILIILFLIVLIIMKFINKGNIDTSSNLQMPSEAELAKKEQQPKLQPVVVTPKPEPKKEEPKPEVKPQEPKAKPKPEPKAENKFEIKKEEPKVDTKEQIIEIKKEEPKPQEPKKENIVREEPKKVEEILKKPEPKKEEPKKQEQPKPEPRKVEEPKKQEQPKKAEPIKQPIPSKGGTVRDVSSLSSGSYVQVYALSQYSPNSPSVKKISEQGYTPLAYKSGNLTRVLIGPFKNDNELNKALSDMRTLSKDAFIQRVK